MNVFSAFPTHHWADSTPAQIAISWRKTAQDPLPLPAEITWQQLAQIIENFAQTLPNSAQIIAYSGSHKLFGLLVYLAVIFANKQILGLNPSLSPIQRTQILTDNQVDWLITDEQIAQFITKTNAPREIKFNYQPKQPATLTLTSGSSGKPKAVIHSVQHHLDNAEGVCELMAFRSHHSWLLSLPLFHVSGQGIIWRWLLTSAKLVVSEEKTDFFNALQIVSHASLVPTQLQRYMQNLGHFRPLAVQHILLGGAQIPTELIKIAQEQGIQTYAGYGMTEMASTICAAKNALNHIGEPLKGREVCLHNDEIWVRGAGLGLGYWLDGCIQPFTNQQGWFATKDKGEWMNGCLKVIGRLDNMFISGGENIQPEEIEKTLYQSGLIKNIFVVPKADQEFGERPIAFVDFIDEFSVQAVKNLQSFAHSTLERFKQPIDYIPLNSEKWQQNGIKISRKQLKDYIQTFYLEK